MHVLLFILVVFLVLCFARFISKLIAIAFIGSGVLYGGYMVLQYFVLAVQNDSLSDLLNAVGAFIGGWILIWIGMWIWHES